jgi:hypothetical protein
MRGSRAGSHLAAWPRPRTASPCRPASTSASRPGAEAPSSATTRPPPCLEALLDLERDLVARGQARRIPPPHVQLGSALLEVLLADRMTGATRSQIQRSSLWSPLTSALIACLRCSLRAAGPSLRRRPALTEHRWRERPRTRHGDGRAVTAVRSPRRRHRRSSRAIAGRTIAGRILGGFPAPAQRRVRRLHHGLRRRGPPS